MESYSRDRHAEAGLPKEFACARSTRVRSLQALNPCAADLQAGGIIMGRVRGLAVIFLVNVVLLAALLVLIERLASYALFLNDLVPRLRESNLHDTSYDAEIGWVGMPNVDIEDMYGPGAHLRTNQQGFRNAKDFQPKRNSEKRRIVCSGDSITFGEHVGNDQTSCSLLAKLDPRLERSTWARSDTAWTKRICGTGARPMSWTSTCTFLPSSRTI